MFFCKTFFPIFLAGLVAFVCSSSFIRHCCLRSPSEPVLSYPDFLHNSFLVRRARKSREPTGRSLLVEKLDHVKMLINSTDLQKKRPKASSFHKANFLILCLSHDLFFFFVDISKCEGCYGIISPSFLLPRILVNLTRKRIVGYTKEQEKKIQLMHQMDLKNVIVYRTTRFFRT